MTERTVHVFASGKVQGVFYRASTRQRASELGLAGWVRNLDDGRVEALLSGSAQQVEDMLAWMHQGPAGARVDKLAVTESDELAPDGFVVC